jgi:GNAT superfamily N-acetyltransferase
MNVRSAEPADIDALARIWHDAWHEAHAALVPAELTAVRTLESFRERLAVALPNVRVAGPPGAPLGFCIVKGDELYQLFVAADARGSGAAAALLADGEDRLATNRVAVGWLACAIGNDRAARFYEKSGWRRVGNMINAAETSTGLFPLEVWRYEKELRTPP